jgi:hypothetical protein
MVAKYYIEKIKFIFNVILFIIININCILINLYLDI